MRSFIPFAVASLLLAAPGAYAQTASPDNDTNPPGTAAGRALDRAAGTDTSGAYPNQADGTAENPKGTMASREGHKLNSKTRHAASRHKQSLKNNSASRAVDRVAGTNNSGAYPAQADGTPENPSGTAVSRTLGTTDPK